MSAIAGIHFLDKRPLDPTDLKRMLKAVVHRGPNGSGLWFRGSVGLGHRLLWTTPESLREKLPLTNDPGDLVITADARIDNRQELIAALELKGRPHLQITDSELILRAYERWGDSCPKKLIGDFAFAIWDVRKQTLFCARDHFGVKPFYYYCSDRAFIFGSEIKTLLSVEEVPHRLTEFREAGNSVPMLDKEITFYQGILRLPPAHCISVSQEGVHRQPYWSLDPSREIHCGSDEEYEETFRGIFTEAVRCRLRSAFPVGSMLSGGLDSCSVVCVARDLLAQVGDGLLHTFSAVGASDCDESRYCSAIVDREGVQSHFVPEDRVHPGAALDHFLTDDHAFNAPPYSALYRAAQGQGVRVLLDGLDGDSTVCYGSAYLAQLARTDGWGKLTREITALASRLNRSSWNIFRERALSPLVPEGARLAFGALQENNGRPQENNTVVGPIAGKTGLASRLKSLGGGRLKPRAASKEDYLRWLAWGVHPFLLEMTDLAAAAFAVEPRHVCFDIRLAEFCLALPQEQELQHGWTRMVVRRAMADIRLRKFGRTAARTT